MVYVGARDREIRLQQAAQELIDMPETADVSEVAARKGVSEEEIINKKEQIEAPPQHFNVGRGSEVQDARSRGDEVVKVQQGVYKIIDKNTGVVTEYVDKQAYEEGLKKSLPLQTEEELIRRLNVERGEQYFKSTPTSVIAGDMKVERGSLTVVPSSATVLGKPEAFEVIDEKRKHIKEAGLQTSSPITSQLILNPAAGVEAKVAQLKIEKESRIAQALNPLSGASTLLQEKVNIAQQQKLYEMRKPQYETKRLKEWEQAYPKLAIIRSSTKSIVEPITQPIIKFSTPTTVLIGKRLKSGYETISKIEEYPSKKIMVKGKPLYEGLVDIQSGLEKQTTSRFYTLLSRGKEFSDFISQPSSKKEGDDYSNISKQRGYLSFGHKFNEVTSDFKNFFKVTGKVGVAGISYGSSLFQEQFLKGLGAPSITKPVTASASLYFLKKSFSKFPIITSTGVISSTGYSVYKQPTVERKISYGLGEALNIGVLYSINKVAPTFSYRKLEIPSKSGVDKIKVFGLETKGGRAFPFFTSDKTGIKIGSKDISSQLLKMPEGTEIKIASPLETVIVKKSLLSLSKSGNVVSERRAEVLIPTLQNIIRKGTSTVLIKKYPFPKITERLSEKGVKIVLSQAKKYKGVVSGSFSREGELSTLYKKEGGTYVLIKEPRDIDIHFDNLKPEQIQKISYETLGLFRKAGINSKIIDEGGIVKNAIMVKQPSGAYEKSVEFLGKGTIPQEEAVPEMVVGFDKFSRRQKVQGIYKTSLKEELKGVVQGVARLKNIGGKIDVFPSEKRVKDIGSVSVTSRTLYQRQFFKRPFFLKDIERFEELYPKNVVNEQVKMVLADYSEGSFDRLFSNVLSPLSASVGGSLLSVEGGNLKFISPSPVDRVEPSGGFGFSNYHKSVSSALRSISPSISRSVSPSKISSSSLSVSVSPSKFRSISPSKSISPSPSVSISPSLSKSVSLGVSPSISISVSPSSSKSPSRSVSPSGSISKSVSPSSSLSVSVSHSRSISKSVSPSSSLSVSVSHSRSISKSVSPSSSLSVSVSHSRSKSVSPSFPLIIKKLKKQKAYQLFIKRKGKQKLIGTFTKQAALDIGAKIVNESLAASFKITPTTKAALNIKTSGEFSQLAKTLRAYKIMRGRKVRLPEGEYIEKRRYRLSTPTEVGEILKSKKATNLFKKIKQKSNVRRGWGGIKWF